MIKELITGIVLLLILSGMIGCFALLERENARQNSKITEILAQANEIY
ncbi:MAG: hypothetical protein MJ179_04960 [Treponema sp.]|nr:hypothetical protein [Treponema sp.]